MSTHVERNVRNQVQYVRKKIYKKEIDQFVSL